MLRWIPVLDVRGGVAVLARAGEREHYQPLRSAFHPEPNPRAIAGAIRNQLGPTPLYLADLDAIEGGKPDLALIRDLAAIGLKVWVDAGVRQAEDVGPIRDAGAEVVIAGLETLGGPECLEACVQVAGTDQLSFSLDLKNGQPMIASGSRWGTSEPLELAAMAQARGVSRLIVLDLVRVGTGSGPGTLELIRQIRERYPRLRCVGGGGIAGLEDLEALCAAGAEAALVGSALHDGRFRMREGHQAASARSED